MGRSNALDCGQCALPVFSENKYSEFNKANKTYGRATGLPTWCASYGVAQQTTEGRIKVSAAQIILPRNTRSVPVGHTGQKRVVHQLSHAQNSLRATARAKKPCTVGRRTARFRRRTGSPAQRAKETDQLADCHAQFRVARAEPRTPIIGLFLPSARATFHVVERVLETLSAVTTSDEYKDRMHAIDNHYAGVDAPEREQLKQMVFNGTKVVRGKTLRHVLSQNFNYGSCVRWPYGQVPRIGLAPDVQKQIYPNVTRSEYGYEATMGYCEKITQTPDARLLQHHKKQIAGLRKRPLRTESKAQLLQVSRNDGNQHRVRA